MLWLSLKLIKSNVVKFSYNLIFFGNKKGKEVYSVVLWDQEIIAISIWGWWLNNIITIMSLIFIIWKILRKLNCEIVGISTENKKWGKNPLFKTIRLFLLSLADFSQVIVVDFIFYWKRQRMWTAQTICFNHLLFFFHRGVISIYLNFLLQKFLFSRMKNW